MEEVIAWRRFYRRRQNGKDNLPTAPPIINLAALKEAASVLDSTASLMTEC